MTYPQSIDHFVDKLNKKQDGVYVIEEELQLVGGIYEGYLEHDNARNESVQFYTGPKLTGSKVDSYFISTPSETPWKRHVKVFSDADVVYVTYETIGDQVEAEDINRLQDSMTATQEEVDRYKSENDRTVDEIDIRLTDVEDTKAEKTYVDTELNKKYDKDQVYTKEEVLQKIEDIIDAAPEALDTLGKIARALDEDPDFAATVTNSLAEKVDKVVGKGLSTEDFTTAEKGKLAGVEAGANKYTHPSTHPADMITETPNKRFSSDVEKASWNAKETPLGAQSKADKAEQNAIEWAKGFGLGASDIRGIDWNDDSLATGFYNGIDNAPGGLPGNGTIYGVHINRNNNAYAFQMVGRASRFFFRTRENRVWGSWIELETTNGAQTKANAAETNAKSYADSIKPTKVSQLTNDENYVTQSELGNAGYGDMTKAVYDKNNNGKVDAAETADSVPWAGVTGRPSTFPPSSHPHIIGNITGLQDALDSKETPAGAQAKIDAIEIGGRNLLKNTSDEFKTYDRTHGWGDWDSDRSHLDMPVQPGETYTVKVCLKSNSINSKNVYIMARLTESRGSSTPRNDFYGNPITPNSEGYSELTFTVPANRYYLTINTIRFNSNEYERNIVHFKELKLEKGHKATDWTPAPEDMMPAGPITWNQLKGV
ncbi:hypothetical protein BEP19_09760 [Ammoniphilus oxalaticus]|uniref:Uncharacterized protein n=1 Tax=Ammoniphilus oxalaticus TaxID=66863 RepID=A0A419SFI3_9BACL|nr:hypothetical protein [Ammoniphilus oxalaticus]RKD22537.1 hypothetical protein BEP19_09760 [Ammoniphilus oxalaticus]